MATGIVQHLAPIRKETPVTIETPMTDSLSMAARAALDRFAQLEACREREPRLKIDQRDWLLWHHDSYHPARRAWDQAMDVLEQLLGTSFPDRAVHEWKPVCIQILTGEHMTSGKR
jgi:hypothetical protein